MMNQFQPGVSLIISAYNEEKVIEEKILNSLEINYPKELLEIVVISDGSEDKTNEIVARYADKGVLLRHYEGRIGKSACLNKAVHLAKGEIIIFSDANSKYDKNAIKELVKHFSNTKIGFVTGITKYIFNRDDNNFASVGLYSKLEQLMKRLESKISSCVGADGAIFAIRKHLYQSLKDSDINDFVIPLNVIRQGYRGILEEKAFCIEKTAGDVQSEFNRQARITNRTLRAIFNNKDMLNPLRFGFFSLNLFSHKVLKFLIPFLLLIILLTNFFLAKRGTIYTFILAGQLFFYLFSWLGYQYRGRRLPGLIAISYNFIIVNLAILLGWIKLLKGETYTAWTTVR